MIVLFSLAFMLTSALAKSQSNNQEPIRLSLEQARQFAIEHSYRMKDARKDLEIADKRVWEFTALGLPQVDAQVGYNNYFDLPTSLVPAEFFGGQAGEFLEVQFGVEQSLLASASVNQLLFDGSYLVGLRTVRIFRELAAQQLVSSEIETKNQITESYLLALLANENLAIVQKNLVNMNRTLAETEAIFKAGLTDPINVDQLKLTVANMKNDIFNFERQQTLTQNLLKYQLGLDVEQKIILTDSLEGLFEALTLEVIAATEFRLENHIDYQISLSQETFDFMAFRREKSFNLPVLTANYSYQQLSMSNSFNFWDSDVSWYPTSFLGVSLNIPIISSGHRASKVQQARLRYEKARLNTENVSQRLRVQLDQALADFETAFERYGNEKENLALAQRIIDRTIIMHREGLATSLELTQASDQFLATQAKYVSVIFDLLRAKNNIEKALGLI